MVFMRHLTFLVWFVVTDTVKLVSSIVGGIAAGVVMLLLLFALVKRRPCRGNCWTSYDVIGIRSHIYSDKFF